jgi:hypothetical protein
MLLLLLLLLEEVHNVGLLGVTGGAVTGSRFHLLGSRGLNLQTRKKISVRTEEKNIQKYRQSNSGNFHILEYTHILKC